MIEKLIVDVSESTQDYMGQLPSIQSKGGVIEFKRGLNIIVGANGTGKTSILNAIGNHLAANHTGASRITQKWLFELNFTSDRSDGEEKVDVVMPHKVIHDGQPILYANPKQGIGITVGGVDDELGGLGALEVVNMSRESSGEQSNRRITPYLDVLQGRSEFPADLMTTINLDTISQHWSQRVHAIMEKVFNPSIPKGQPTVLLDEPETGLGLMNQILLWEKVLKNPEVQDKFQIILVSHSHVCLDIEGANYIELQDGYLDACRALMRGELDSGEINSFATNLPRQLNKREMTMLKKISDAKDGLAINTDSKALDELIELELVEQLRRRIKAPTDDKTGNPRRSWRPKFEYLYFLTEKGNQYLHLQS